MKNPPSTNKSAKKATRVPGIDKGKVIIKPDFDAPLPEFE